MFKTELNFDILCAKSDGRCDILMRSANKQSSITSKSNQRAHKTLTLDAY